MAAYRNKITGKKVEAVQLTIGTFAAPRPNLDRIIGVLYNRREGAAFIKNGAERANIGDWIVQDQYGNPSVVSAHTFSCEYEPVSADVIPLRR